MTGKEPLEIFERLRGIDKGYSGEPFLESILEGTTPVPFFGDYQNASVVTLSLNPSSDEFLSQERRLVHLRDLKLSENFYKDGNRLDETLLARRIFDGLENYFEQETWYKDWFEKPEKALNIGLNASYRSEIVQKLGGLKACHTDLSPWATKSWRRLNSLTKNSMIHENGNFLSWFLSLDHFKQIVILGSGSEKGLRKSSRRTDLYFPFELHEVHSERVEDFSDGTFSSGILRIGFGGNSVEKQYFYNSFPPTVPYRSDNEQTLRYELFGNYIKRIVSSGVGGV